MRVFVTGATGFVGSAVVQELLRAGHQVLGLARSDASAQALTDVGADVHRGSIEDLHSLTSGAAQADGVIHTAFIHDFSKFLENCEKDRLAIGALGAALKGTKKPLIVTSGTALVSTGRLATENDLPDPQGQNPRVASDLAVAKLAEEGVRVSLVRLPPSVHGAENAIYHANSEEGVPFRDIATLIGKHLNLPVVSKNGQDLAAHFGWFTHFASLNNPTSSQFTRDILGWKPVHPDLLTDIDTAGYFK